MNIIYQLRRGLIGAVAVGICSFGAYAGATDSYIESLRQEVRGSTLPLPTGEINDIHSLPVPEKGNWKEGKTVSTAPRQTPAMRAGEMKGGFYVSKDMALSQGGGVTETNFPLNIQQDELYWNVTGYLGITTSSIKITVSARRGTVSIQAQKFFDNSTYGEVWVAPIDLTTMQYDLEGTISGTLDEKGVITLPSWGIFVKSGQYAGGTFGIYRDSRWLPANATIKLTDTSDETETFGAVIEQTANDKVKIFNFGGNGTPINGTLTPSKTIKFSPQLITNHAMYGELYIFAADFANNRYNTTQPILATTTETSITTGNWVVASRMMPDKRFMSVAKSEITLEGITLSYPEKLTVTFTGAGTASSPYQLKTPNDLDMLSQSVADGESYAGKYFSVTGDIDMGTSARSYCPIGNEGSSFEGTFDGGNHTISNLKIAGDGFYDQGLFGYVGANATVKNIKLAGVNITGNGDNYGAIAGRIFGKVENCHAEGYIETSGLWTGGIAGRCQGSINNCSFKGNLSGYGTVGGIVAVLHGTLANCHANVSAKITGYVSDYHNEVGGIVGILMPSNQSKPSVSDCSVTGILSDSKGYAMQGGVVATCINSTISRCFNTAVLQGHQSNPEKPNALGGVVGYINDSHVNDCFNAGSIVKTGKYGSEQVGGVVGYMSVVYGSDIEGKSYFKNCYNSAPVTSSHSNLLRKGLWGTTFYHRPEIDPAEGCFTNCYFDKQTSGLGDTEYGRNTSYFTGGQLPEGFDAVVWTAKAGAYPLLKGMESGSGAELASSVPMLSNNETATKVRSAFSVNGPSTVKWGLMGTNGILTSSGGLDINGTNVTLTGDYANEVLVAYTDNGALMRTWPLAVAPKIFEGEGTAQSPFLIKSVDDFVKLNRAVSTYLQPHVGDHFLLTNDIDFNYNEKFSGIGANNINATFSGVFDGGNHHIKRLKIHGVQFEEDGKATAKGAFLYGALFAIAGPESEIRNIIVDADADLMYYGSSAAIVGYTEGLVENCRNYANITGVYEQMAGIAGVTMSTATVRNCYNAGNITAGREAAGGIVGFNRGGKIEKCQNDGIIAAKYVNEYVPGNSQTRAGGIVGYNSGAIENCLNTAPVSAYREVGGIAGYHTSMYGENSLVKNVNTGIVTMGGNATTRGAITGNYSKGKVTEYNYFDASVITFGSCNSATIKGTIGMTSAELISGTVLPGLDLDTWTFQGGRYPMLKAFADEEAGKAYSKLFMYLGADENVDNINKDVFLADDENIKWEISGSEHFRIEGRYLKVKNPEGMELGKGVLKGTYGTKYVKEFSLLSLPKLFPGSGTAEAPYQISTADDMLSLSNFIDKNKVTFGGMYFRVENNIDLSKSEYNPIAIGANSFNATFDGNGKSIRYSYTNTTTGDKGRYVGLFGTVGSTGTVKNLTVEGTLDINGYSGTIAGQLYGTIDNCVNKMNAYTQVSGIAMVGTAYDGASVLNSSNYGEVTSGNMEAAGIVSRADYGSLIQNCKNYGKINSAGGNSAGIVFKSWGTVRDCENRGSISGTSGIGGIAYELGAQAVLENCSNYANIELPLAASVAGIAAVVYESKEASVTITNCHNYGNITGKNSVGGLFHDLRNGALVTDCSNKGAVSALSGGSVAGVVVTCGYESSGKKTELRNCYNEGVITAMGNYAGGFGGNLPWAYLYDCHNSGEVNNSSYITGGLCGSLSGYAYNCYNEGDVTSSGYGLGGISGIGSGTIENCYNLGKLTVINGYTSAQNPFFGNAGGLWGYGQSKARNCFNLGDIKAPCGVSGTNAALWVEGEVTNCFNGGKLTITNGDYSRSDQVFWLMPNGGLAASEGTVVYSNNYYDKQLNSEWPVSKRGTGLTTSEMYALDLGEAFVNNEACYPMLSSSKGHPRAAAMAAGVLFKDGESYEAVKSVMTLGLPEGAVWTASENITLSGNKAYPSAIGKGWLKVSTPDGKYERTLEVNVTGTAGIDDILHGTDIIAIEYFDLNGRKIAQPSAGGVYIIRTTLSNGEVNVEKKVVK